MLGLCFFELWLFESLELCLFELIGLFVMFELSDLFELCLLESFELFGLFVLCLLRLFLFELCFF